MLLRKIFCFFVCVSVFAGFIVPLHADANAKESNLVFIFDASGSMWGQINGKAKITIAKEAMKAIIKSLPDNINVGLVAYGHRKKGDCDDVETLIPLSKIDKQALLARVSAINPKGKTPIVRSVKLTAESIKHIEDETTILLVSDGEETCDSEPCAFIRELKGLGINFIMHVVGFDVGPKIEEQLRCMAKAGGGEYFPASDADNLKNALDIVVKKTVAQNLIILSFDDKSAPLSARVNVLNQSGVIVASDAGPRVGFGLTPGTYLIVVKPETMSESQTITGITVTADQVTQKKVVFAKAKIRVSLKDNSGNPVKGYIRVVNMQTGQYAAQDDHKGKFTEFVVSPGNYQVIMECLDTGAKIKSEPFTLAPGETRQVNGVCGKARIGVFVKDQNGSPVIGYVRIVDVPNDNYAEQGDSGKTMKFFKVPPGTYKVDVECPDSKRIRSKIFQIQPGQEVKVEINCQSGNARIISAAGG